MIILEVLYYMYLGSHQQVDNLFISRPQCAQFASFVKHEASVKGLNPELVARIMIVESNCKANAVNKRSHDYGLMQINKLHKISKECLKDARCNIKAGVSILHSFRKKRICAYNVGFRIDSLPKTCETYERKLRRLK